MSQDNFIKKLLNIKEKNLEITNVIEENIKGVLKVSLRIFKKYIDYIENSLDFEYSNGRIKGINRKIKVLKHISYSYGSFLNFRKRILISTII